MSWISTLLVINFVKLEAKTVYPVRRGPLGPCPWLASTVECGYGRFLFDFVVIFWLFPVIYDGLWLENFGLLVAAYKRALVLLGSLMTPNRSLPPSFIENFRASRIQIPNSLCL